MIDAEVSSVPVSTPNQYVWVPKHPLIPPMLTEFCHLSHWQAGCHIPLQWPVAGSWLFIPGFEQLSKLHCRAFISQDNLHSWILQSKVTNLQHYLVIESYSYSHIVAVRLFVLPFPHTQTHNIHRHTRVSKESHSLTKNPIINKTIWYWPCSFITIKSKSV